MLDSSFNQSGCGSFINKIVRRFSLISAVLLLFELTLSGHLLRAEEIVADSRLPEMMLDAIKSAIKTHPEVLKADSEMLSANMQVKAGEYRWFPIAEMSVRTGERGDRYSTMGVNQPLWDNGRRNAEFDAARAGASAAYESKYLSMQSLGIAATDAYLGLARARQQLSVAEANVAEHKKLHASVMKRNLGGVASKSDASLATSRLQQALANEKQAQGEVAKAEAQYFAVTGLKPSASDVPELNLLELPGGQEGLVNKVIGRSPSLKKLKEEIKVAEANLASSRAQLEVDADGSAATYSFVKVFDITAVSSNITNDNLFNLYQAGQLVG